MEIIAMVAALVLIGALILKDRRKRKPVVVTKVPLDGGTGTQSGGGGGSPDDGKLTPGTDRF